MADINTQFEKEHLRQLQALQKRIALAYGETIVNVFKAATGLQARRDTFRITDYPALETILERELLKLQAGIEGMVVNGIQSQWELSLQKFGALIDQRYRGKAIPTPLKQAIFNPNKGAMDAFLKRKTNGLTLSDRVWNNVKQFRGELEQGLYLGISEGKPAAKMATEMKQYLKEPDKLFRRVRDAEGNLQLSKAAQEYKPGQGVYRSSYKNALRVARTETNMAYRAADHERWKKTDFILGFEVKLSNSHPRPDICDSLKGVYPKEFKFTSWHPNCLCFAVPILPTAEQYNEYEKALLRGEEKGFKFEDVVREPHEGFRSYYESQKQTIEGYQSTPYWVKDNPKYTKAKSPSN
ncbi:hypothetical protein Q4E40_02635 [Pontibacter sp. BT731]|uniref:hypothetical protein n=1 Tax=Pontibacter coccineus TaxID=3063328 RepID=UPI0026E2E7D7|nr:hypothetical protein [Pontibacter sp. BT731]MDO6389009.1 hypothetical protein [Pontibacter sp. BT731]